MADQDQGQPIGEEQAAPSLQCLPVEILTKIYGELNIKGAFRLSCTNRRMHQIYKCNTIPILQPILSREFSPLDGLLRITDAVPSNSEPAFETWHNRPISFGGLLGSDDHDSGCVLLEPTRFNAEHVCQILKVVEAVSRWESAFPRLRFANVVEERRMLEPHEKERLRRALYAWWRFAKAYHQHHDRRDKEASFFTGLSYGEIGADSLRMLSTAQLYELRDLWKTVEEAVTTQLCPSLRLVLREQGGYVREDYLEQRAWGDGMDNICIIGSVLRLGPDQLLELLNLATSDPAGAGRDKMLPRIREYHPSFDRDFEILSYTLDHVITERVTGLIPCHGHTKANNMAAFVDHHLYPKPCGGILDGTARGEAARLLLDGPGVDATLSSEEDDEEDFGF